MGHLRGTPLDAVVGYSRGREDITNTAVGGVRVCEQRAVFQASKKLRSAGMVRWDRESLVRSNSSANATFGGAVGVQFGGVPGRGSRSE